MRSRDSWWRRFTRSTRSGPEVAEELQFHVDQLVRDLVAGGMSQEDAAREASRRFGDRTRVQSQLERIERHRGRRLRLGVWLAELGSDLRYGLRGILKRPGYSFAAAASLALGIGTATVVLSIVDSWFWRPLAVPRADELILVGARYRAVGSILVPNISLPLLGDLAERRDLFRGVAGWRIAAVATRPASVPQGELVVALMTTGNYFDLLGVRPALGRTYAESDSRDRNPVAVLNHGFWKSRFGGDSAVIGRQQIVAGVPVTVIGVLPASFTGTEALLDVAMYLPSGLEGVLDPSLATLETDRSRGLYQVIARPQRGRSFDEVEAGIAVLSRQLAETYKELPEGYQIVALRERDARPTISVASMSQLVGSLLLGLAALVLAAAAVNVTNLVLTRASTRHEELAVRLALGASRGRVVRQMLTESALLGLLGFVGAYGLARLAVGAISRIGVAGGIRFHFAFSLDGRVLGMSLVLALVAGVASGFGPALIASRGVSGTLRRAGRSGLGGQGSRFRAGLVIAQVAASFIALVSAGLFAQSARRAADVDLGMEPAGITVATLDASQARADATTGPGLIMRVRRAILEVPGVDSVAFATTTPLTPMYNDFFELFQTGAANQDRKGATSVMGSVVTRDYFDVMGIPALRGRVFLESDDSLAPRVAVINERAAKDLWPDRDPLGQRFRTAPDGPPIEVVGVVPTGRYLLITEEPRGFVYFPATQRSFTFGSLIVKSREDPTRLAGPIRAAIAGVDPNLVPLGVTTMRSYVEDGLNGLLPLRLGMRLTSAVGLLALVLTIVGLYGVLSYSVTQETREIGVRMALGAEPGSIVRRVLGRGGRLVLAGIGAGLVLALVGTRAISAVLVGVRSTDVGVYVGVAIGLVLIAAAAAFLPARRASRLDPVTALRSDG